MENSRFSEKTIRAPWEGVVNPLLTGGLTVPPPNRVRSEGLNASGGPDYFAPRSEIGSTMAETNPQSLFLSGFRRPRGPVGKPLVGGDSLVPLFVHVPWRSSDFPVFSGWISPFAEGQVSRTAVRVTIPGRNWFQFETIRRPTAGAGPGPHPELRRACRRLSAGSCSGVPPAGPEPPPGSPRRDCRPRPRRR